MLLVEATLTVAYSNIFLPEELSTLIRTLLGSLLRKLPLISAEYSKQLMREAKAHFEEVAMLATPPSESETGSVQTNTGQETDSPASSGEQVATGQAPAASGTTAPDGVTSGSDDTTPSPSGARSASPEATPSSSSSSSSNSSLLSTSGSDEGSSSVAQQSSQSSAPSSVDCNPRTALAAAHKATKQPGSATALILQLREGSTTLKASNLVRPWLLHLFSTTFWKAQVALSGR